MPLNLTKQTKIVWASYADAFQEDLHIDRTIFVDQMVYDGKTDGTVIVENDTTYHRPFIDLPAAQEFVDFITQCALEHNCTIISHDIMDYNAT